MAEIRQGLTFDDVLILPKYSNVLPSSVSLKTNLTKKITLNIPIISAAMDTVTESRLAIALALHGGIGIIHKNMTPEKQAEEVKRVKRFRNGFIHEPVTIEPKKTIKELYELTQKTTFSKIPVVENNKLVGLISDKDYSIKQHENLLVKDRMTPREELIIAKKTITIEEANRLLIDSKKQMLCIIDDNEHLISIVSRKDIEKTEEFPNACQDKDNNLRVGAAVGPFDDERVDKLVKEHIDVIVVDTAHGHSENVINAVKRYKQKYPELQIIAGNVATRQGALDLAAAGADAIKVGVGPGSICTTRIIAGIGVPQITAIEEAAKESTVPIIADGGIRYSGDIAKAIAAGASCVMVGSLLAGCEETPTDTIYIKGRKYKKYRGMGSIGAMSQGSKDRYAQKDITETKKFVAEGIEGVVPYRGTVHEVTYQLIGGLRSSMGYTGSKNIEELRTKNEFIQITSNGLKESHPHDITITEEAPNYSLDK